MPAAARSTLLRGLVRADAPGLLELARKLLDPAESDEMILGTLSGLTGSPRPDIGPIVAGVWGKLNPAVRPQAIDLLSARATWSGTLLDAVEKKEIPTQAVNANQLRRILAHPDATLKDRVGKLFGAIRAGDNQSRQEVIRRYTRAMNQAKADPDKGYQVYKKVCAQCHQIKGEGHNVGPDLVGSGRASREQLISNILDPNLVIGRDYQARLVVMNDGRVLTGLVVEDSPQRVVLRVAGGKEEKLPRGEIESIKVSTVSLMPEDLEKQVNETEFRDLVAWLMKL
jgi:putative heme-binding domain-containing protein